MIYIIFPSLQKMGFWGFGVLGFGAYMCVWVWVCVGVCMGVGV